jgi:hypothetical protein
MRQLGSYKGFLIFENYQNQEHPGLWAVTLYRLINNTRYYEEL